MRDKWHEHRYTFYKRNGKDCYTWFRLDESGRTVFTSARHKISLNAYRFFTFRAELRNNGIYI